MRFPAPSGVIALITDFGNGDHYVGVMKGVILNIFEQACVVDVCHQVQSFSIEQAAFLLHQSYRYFPSGSVHVVVVDPGVGSERRPLAAAADGHYFIAPDNGALSLVFEHRDPEVRELNHQRFGLQPMSRTFHGRDLFSPAAAWLASGKSFADFGETIDDWLRLPSAEPARRPEGGWSGRILNIDRFGNIVTSIPRTLLQPQFRLRAGSLEVQRRVETYADAETGEPFAIIGSGDLVEISLREDSAAERARVAIGDLVELE